MASLADLTKKQRAVYEFIRDLIRNRGYGPTVREIGDRFKIKSPNGVVCHLQALEKKGLIRRDSNRARGIRLIQETLGIHSQLAEYSNENDRLGAGELPFAGVVSAGFTKQAFELDDTINFDEMFAGQGVFVLRVDGDSMIEAHISDGDYVICKQADSAERGQMVVALNENSEATLKYWFPEANRIRLQPANSSMKPLYVRDARVRGVVVGVVRTRVD